MFQKQWSFNETRVDFECQADFHYMTQMVEMRNPYDEDKNCCNKQSNPNFVE